VQVALIGGNLQGVEAAYLAKKAGWEVILVDRKPNVPAAGLCDRFIQQEISHGLNQESVLKDIDLVFPALENEAALNCLNDFTHAENIPFAFDLNAYRISSSKLESDRLFEQREVPAPRPWPGCDFPVVAKPSVGSGSQGVAILENKADLNAYVSASSDQWVIQEYVQGPSYSIEILGRPGQYTALQVTDLEMDAGYDRDNTQPCR
jgi:pyrrolysine biosynthesis protein PylC